MDTINTISKMLVEMMIILLTIYFFFQMKNKSIKMRIICSPTSPSLKAVGNRESDKMRGQNKTRKKQTNQTLPYARCI